MKRLGLDSSANAEEVVSQVVQLAQKKDPRGSDAATMMKAYSEQALWEMVGLGKTTAALEATETLVAEHQLKPTPRLLNFLATGLCEDGNSNKAVDLLKRMKDEHGACITIQKLLKISKMLINEGKIDDALALSGYFLEGDGGEKARKDFTSEIVLELSRRNYPEPALTVYMRYLDAGCIDENGGILNMILREIAKRGAWGRVLDVLHQAQEKGVVVNETMIEATVKGLAVNGRMEKAIGLLPTFGKYGEASRRLRSSVRHVARGYAQKGAIGELEEFISTMEKNYSIKPSAVEINDLLVGYARRGRLPDALSLAERMKEQYGCVPSDLALEVMVIGMMAQGATEQAVNFINTTEEKFSKKPPVQMANAVAGYLAGRGQVKEATEFVCSMRDILNVTPDDSTLAALVGGLFHLQHAGGILDRVAQLSREVDIQPAHATVAALVEGFGRLKELDRAHDLIDSMEDSYGIKPDHACLKSLLISFCISDDADRAFGLLEGMEEVYGVAPTPVFVNSVAGAFASNARFDHVNELVDVMYERYDVAPTSTTLKHIVQGLQRLSVKSSRPGSPGGALVGGKSIVEVVELAVEKFLKDFGVTPEVNTLLRMVATYCGTGEMRKAQQLIDTMEAKYGVRPDSSMITTLVSGYSKRGDTGGARTQMKRCESAYGSSPDHITYNALLRGHCTKGQMFEAIQCVEEMAALGLAPDSETVNHLALGYKRRGELQKAQEVMDMMREKYAVSANVRAMNQLVDAHIKTGNFEDAKALAFSMESTYGLTPSAVTVNLLTSALIRSGDFWGADAIAQSFYTSFKCSLSVDVANQIVRKFLVSGEEAQATEIVNGLRDRYGITPSPDMLSQLIRFKLLQESPNLEEAVETALTLPPKLGLTAHYPALLSRIVTRWTTTHGKVEAFKEFLWQVTEATGCQPPSDTIAAIAHGIANQGSYADAAAFLTEAKGQFQTPLDTEMADAVVSGIVLSGDMEQAERAFSAMQEEFGATPTQRTANFLVGGFASAGKMEDALRVADTVKDYAANSGSTSTLEFLVRGFVAKGDVERAEQLIRSERFPVSAGAFMPLIERATVRTDVRRIQECLDFMVKLELTPPIDAWNQYIAAALESGGLAARDSAYKRMTAYGAVPDNRTFAILRRK